MINNAILPDTDVLIFQDITKYYENVNRKFHFSRGSTGYMGFVFTETIYLKQICNFIVSQYKSDKSLNELKNDYQNWMINNKTGGVSDITLFEKYEKANPNCSFNFEIPIVNGKAFINSLDSPYYIHNKKGYVKFFWKKNTPFAKLLDGKLVSIIGVHCFGSQKLQIRNLYQGKGWIISRVIYLWKNSLLKKIYRKLIIRK